MSERHDVWRAQYDADMRQAAVIYSDVVAALKCLEVPAEVTQTGGMCLAITFPARGSHWLLTDVEGPLPWARDDVSGWALGLYDDEGGIVIDPVTTNDASIAGAVALAVSTAAGENRTNAGFGSSRMTAM